MKQGDTLSILYGDSVLDTEYSYNAFQGLAVNLDGTAAALLADNGTLSYIRDNTITELANKVIRYVISVNGDGVAYVTKNGDLFLYRHTTGETVPVASSLAFMPVISSTDYISSSSFVISPDGATVACLISNVEDFYSSVLSSSLGSSSLHLYTDGVLTKLESQASYSINTNLLSVSNQGCVYLKVGNFLRSHDIDGNFTDLGTTHNAYADFYLSEVPNQYLNADHTQLLYFTEEGTFLSENGKPGQMLSQQWLEPIMPKLASRIELDNTTATYPYLSFYDQVFSSDHNSAVPPKYTIVSNLHYVASDGTVQELATNAKGGWLVPSGDVVYCLYEDGTLERIHIATGTATPIAAGVRDFTVTYDQETLYYVSTNGILYACDPLNGDNILRIGTINSSYLFTTSMAICIGPTS